MQGELFQEVLKKETAVSAFLDLTNMFHWQNVLGWKFHLEDIIRQLLSLPSMREVRVYYGINDRDASSSKRFHARIRSTGAILIAKPVKWVRREVNHGMFFKQATRSLFSPIVTEKVNDFVSYLRQTGTVIEEPKCNFDVEMTMDLLDVIDKVSAVVVFSGDSDLHAPLQRLKIKGKQIYICGVRGHTARELMVLTGGFVNFGKWYNGKRYYEKAKIPLVAGPRV